MTQIQKYALLKDLAQLIRKYGPDAFSELAEFLKNPQALSELAIILEAGERAGRVARVGEGGHSTKPKSAIEGLQHFLSDIKSREPEKANLLSDLYSSLTAKRALPTLRELRTFAQDNGLKPVKATSRDKAIAPFIRELAMRPINDVRLLLAHINMRDTIHDRSLEGWTGVILNKQRSRH